MPLYEYGCDGCGDRFSRLVPRPGGPAPDCPSCGGAARKRISSFAVGGRADPGPGPEQAPTSWEATNRGDRDTISGWHRALERRERLEQRHPELAAPRRAVLAHEGRHHHQPLYADPPTGGDTG